MCTYVDSVVTFVIGKANSQRNRLELLLEQIGLVEEKDDGGVGKSKVVDNVIEQGHALVQPNLLGQEREFDMIEAVTT